MTDPPSRPSYSYADLHRAGRPGWWRPLIGVLIVAALTYAVAPLVAQGALAGWFGATGRPVAESIDRVIDLENPTPAGLAVVNVVLASGVLSAWLVSRVLHGLRPRWLASVAPRIRWRFLAACLGLSVLALLATLVSSGLIYAIAAPPDSFDPGEGLNDFTTTTRDFLLVIAFLTPLQAAGEEYVFRGYLTQAFGGAFGSAAAVAVPAVLFALAHGLEQGLPVFLDRLAFGVIAGVLVLRTGGLEAGIAMHVLNNWLAFGFGLAFGDMSTTLNPEQGRWLDTVPTLVQSLAYFWLVTRLASRWSLSARVTASELVAPSVSVYRFPSAETGP
ncbi:MAG: lysostaphin resistance A-like protein [Nocardioides sp.]